MVAATAIEQVQPIVWHCANMRRPKVAKLAQCARLRAVVEDEAPAALVTGADRGLAKTRVP